jgi:hypothetical protein
MPPTRRALIATAGSALLFGTAGCSLNAEHDDEIRLVNERSSPASLTLTARRPDATEPRIEHSVDLAAEATEYVPDPARAGRTTAAHVVTVNTGDGLVAEREWAPSNPAMQLVLRVRSSSLAWDVGPPE